MVAREPAKADENVANQSPSDSVAGREPVSTDEGVAPTIGIVGSLLDNNDSTETVMTKPRLLAPFAETEQQH